MRNRDREAPLNIVYWNGTDQAVYDGDWKRQQLTRSAYFERFALDDADTRERFQHWPLLSDHATVAPRRVEA